MKNQKVGIMSNHVNEHAEFKLVKCGYKNQLARKTKQLESNKVRNINQTSALQNPMSEVDPKR